MKAYIAFSIHGTKAFITASKTFSSMDEIKALEPEFTAVKSRRDNYKPEDGVKLEWSKLMTVENVTDSTGKRMIERPLRSPPAVVVRFKTLERRGWTIDKRAFVHRHWNKNQNLAID